MSETNNNPRSSNSPPAGVRGRPRSWAPGLEKLGREFFQRHAVQVARELIGAILVRRVARRELRARIVETEAYVGPHDLACHASKGRTKRTEIMFGPGGFAYVYFIYGMHAMLNVVTGEQGDAQAVLIRAAEAMDPSSINLSGPGRLAKGLRITVADNGTDLTGDTIFIEPRHGPVPRIIATKRIGVEYAREWQHELLRFYDADSAAVSGRRSGGKTRPGG